jgi:hypothetical protein
MFRNNQSYHNTKLQPQCVCVCVCFFGFPDVVQLALIQRKFRHIWLQTTYEGIQFLEAFNILATS